MTTSDTALRWNPRNLIVACSSITVFGLAFGMTYPLLSLILESRGISTEMIGINAAMMPIGILMFSSIVPTLANRFGARRVAICAAITTAVIMLSYKLFDSLAAWFLLRLLHGMSITTLFVLSEAWIVQFAGDVHRGKVVAVYGSVLSASFGAGPLLVSLVGIGGWLPFIIGAAVCLLGALPLILLKEEQRVEDITKSSTSIQFALKAPLLIAAVFTFAILDAACLSLLPVYGLRVGLDLVESANLLTALIVGNVVLQFPIGALSDRYPHRIVLASLAFLTAAFMLILPFAMATFWQWPVVILAGATGYGIYTVSLTALGKGFDQKELVHGSAAFATTWGVGALIGSVSGGWSMSLFGHHGLPWHLVVVYLGLFWGLIANQLYVKRVK